MSDDHGTTAPAETGHLRRALGVPSLVFFGLVYMVPLTVFTTYGIVTEITGGRVPLAYVITLVAMVFTARSYAKMAGEPPFAGSAYTYTQKTFGAGVGFVAGWALAARLPLPADDQLPRHRPLSQCRPADGPLVGLRPHRHRPRHDPQHHRHRLGGAREHRHHRRPGDLHPHLRRPFLRHHFGLGFGRSRRPVRRRRYRRRFRGRHGRCRDPLPVLPRLRRRLDAVRGGEGSEALGATRDRHRHRDRRDHLHRALVHRSARVPVERVRRPRVGFTRCHGRRRRAVPHDLLHRRLCRRCLRVGADLAGLGLAHPLCDGPRRRAPARVLRSPLQALPHSGLRDGHRRRRLPYSRSPSTSRSSPRW